MSSPAVLARPATENTGPDPKRWLALAVIAAAQLMVVLDASIVNIAMPHAQADLGISDSDRQWIVTAYTLAFGGLLLLGGRIADFAGRKRAFIIGLIGFAAASALGGIAPTAGLLFSARALQGVFAALLAPAALSLITVTFTESKERAKAFGVYGAIAGGGAAIGLIVGGVLTEFASWRWCLGVNVPIALVVVLFAIPLVRESKAHGDTRYDLPGAVTATLGLVALVFGMTKAATDGWSSATPLAMFAASVVFLVAFVGIELKTRHPLLPMRVILDRNRGGSYLTTLLVGAGMFGMFLFLTYYFQGVLGYSALKSGFAFLPFSAGIIVAAGSASQLLPKLGPRPLILTGLSVATLGMLWLSQITVDTSFTTHVLPSEILLSVGLGVSFVALSATALFGVGNHDAGVASAVLNTTQQIGGSLGTALLNTIASTATGGYLVAHAAATDNEGAVHGFSVAFVWSAGILAFAAIVAFFTINATKHSLAKHDTVPAAG